MLAVKIAVSVVLAVLYLGIVYQILVSNKNWESKVFWILFVAVFPVLGAIVYSFGGIDYRRDHVRKRLHAKTMELFLRDTTPQMKEAFFQDGNLSGVKEFFRPLARLLLSAGEGNKVYGNNSYEIITAGQRKRELLEEDLRRARKFIHIEYYRFGADEAGREVRDILFQKAAEGVEVRFIRNNMTNYFSIPDKYFREMEAHGIEVKRFTHIKHGLRNWVMRINHQNHRKIVVIDGKVAYTGGMNLNNNYFYKWRDTHMRITGPVVARLQASYIDTWLACGGRLSHPLPYYFPLETPQEEAPFKDKLLQIVTDAPEFRWPTMQLAYEWILQNAQDYVYIQTPYFMPPDGILEALKSAALRGVDVRLMVPKRVDTLFIGPANQAFYAECMEAGVRLMERDGEFLHAKTLVADDYLTIIGASNLDVRSFTLNNEVNTVVYDTETALFCKDIFLRDTAETKELHLQEWLASRSFWRDLGSRAMRLLYKNL